MRNYLKYFFFITKNWGLPLAVFTLYHEIKGEKKYNIRTTGYDNLSKLKIKSQNKLSAFIYQPVNYYMAEKAFNYLKLQSAEGSLVDYGSGMGRIMAVAAHYGFKNITGIEFAPELCEKAQQNINSIKTRFPDLRAEILCMDAIRYEVKSTDSVFTFFNPFSEKVMLQVVKNILKSLKEHPRDIFVVYFNPTEKEIFLSAGFRELWFYQKMAYLDLSILLLEDQSGLWKTEDKPGSV